MPLTVSVVNYKSMYIYKMSVGALQHERMRMCSLKKNNQLPTLRTEGFCPFPWKMVSQPGNYTKSIGK